MDPVRMLVFGGMAAVGVGAGVAAAHMRSSGNEDSALLAPKLGGGAAVIGGGIATFGFAKAIRNQSSGAHLAERMTHEGVNLLATGSVVAGIGIAALLGGLAGYALAGKQS